MADFFDKVKQGVGKGITTVSVRSKEMVETTRIKGQIGTFQGQRKIAIEELGNIVYTMFLKGGFDEERIKGKCEAIAGVDRQIKEKEEELTQIHLKAQQELGMPKTVSVCACGAPIYEDTKFCGKCGKKVEVLPRKIVEEETTPAICPHCNAQLTPDARFCANCGGKIG